MAELVLDGINQLLDDPLLQLLLSDALATLDMLDEVSQRLEDFFTRLFTAEEWPLTL